MDAYLKPTCLKDLSEKTMLPELRSGLQLCFILLSHSSICTVLEFVGFCCELRVFWVSSKEACMGSGSDSLCSYRCKKQKGERHAMYPNLGGS